jgi:hypothetical protein
MYNPDSLKDDASCAWIDHARPCSSVSSNSRYRAAMAARVGASADLAACFVICLRQNLSCSFGFTTQIQIIIRYYCVGLHMLFISQITKLDVIASNTTSLKALLKG